MKVVRDFFMCFAAMLSFNINISFAAEMRLPDEVELKSAYCISVLQYFIEIETALQEGNVSEEAAQDISDETSKTIDNLNRLQSFLIPRAYYIDMDALRVQTH